MTSNRSDPSIDHPTVSASARHTDDPRTRAKRRLDHVGDHRDIDRARRYGMTLPDFYALLARGACDICKRSDRRLCVDHCHETNRVRGLLCEDCNSGLGRFDDDVRRLEKAEAYLQRPPGVPHASGGPAGGEGGPEPSG